MLCLKVGLVRTPYTIFSPQYHLVPCITHVILAKIVILGASLKAKVLKMWSFYWHCLFCRCPDKSIPKMLQVCSKVPHGGRIKKDCIPKVACLLSRKFVYVFVCLFVVIMCVFVFLFVSRTGPEPSRAKRSQRESNVWLTLRAHSDVKIRGGD